MAFEHFFCLSTKRTRNNKLFIDFQREYGKKLKSLSAFESNFFFFFLFFLLKMTIFCRIIYIYTPHRCNFFRIIRISVSLSVIVISNDSSEAAIQFNMIEKTNFIQEYYENFFPFVRSADQRSV